MNKYYDYNTYKFIDEYCKRKCQDLVIHVNDKNEIKDSDLINILRGQYKGYLYISKTNKYFYRNLKKRSFKLYEIYEHFKKQRGLIYKEYSPNRKFIRGIKESIYDILNQIAQI